MTAATSRISASTIAEIEEGQTMRGWIANSYAQIEYMLGDLILRCRTFPEYEDETLSRFSGMATELIKRVKRILQRSGLLKPYATDLLSVLERSEKGYDTRNLLAHGFCEYLITPYGNGFRFKKWHRQPDRDDARLIRDFRLSDLQAEREASVALAQDAAGLVLRIHTDFGWVALNDKPPPRLV